MIALPHLPAELLALSEDDAVALVQSAVDLAVERGAEVVGLAGFSSIVTFGGLALHAREGVRVTSGNSYTSWVAMQALEAACADQGVSLADRTIAVVGATGAIGHALSLLCAERAAELILIGNPQVADASVGRLRIVAQDCERHVRALAVTGRKFRPGTCGAGAAAPRCGGECRLGHHCHRHRSAPAAGACSADGDERGASVHFRAPSAQRCPGLRHIAAVQRRARPRRGTARRAHGGRRSRSGAGGLGAGAAEEPDRSNVLLACAAETIILALSGFRSEHLVDGLTPRPSRTWARSPQGSFSTAR